VLKLRMDHPEMHSPEMAERLTAQLGKSITSGWVRKRLFVAREKLGELLLSEIRQSLPHSTDEQVVEELITLELLDCCRDALERQRGEG
jgi:hypothetical protein